MERREAIYVICALKVLRFGAERVSRLRSPTCFSAGTSCKRRAVHGADYKIDADCGQQAF